MVRVRTVLGILVCIVLVTACSTVKLAENDSFLIGKLSNKDKAQALSEAGIGLYNQYIKGKDQNLEHFSEVRLFFSVASTFDPQNKDAITYLKLLDDFKDQEFRSSLSSAQKTYASKTRTTDDEYNMVVAIHKALQLDPNSTEAKKLDQDTKQIQVKFAAQNLEKADAATQKLGADTKDDVREAAYIEAFSLSQRALLVLPDNAEAKAKRDAYLGELSKILHARLENIDALITKGNFSQGESQVGIADALNQKIGSPVKPEIEQLRYNLYFTWAKYLAGRKDWVNAKARVQAALYYKRTQEAVDLDKSISTQANQGPGFDTVLANIDALFSKGDLVAATQRITAAMKNAKDKTQVSVLTERQNSINDKIPDLYNKGVQAYRNENFAAAIESLQVVVGVIPSYLDAADYLKKAREKQKVLDKF